MKRHLIVIVVLLIAVISGCNDSNNNELAGICIPKEVRCRSIQVVEICNVNGSDWTVYRTCEQGDSCIDGHCKPSGIVDGDDSDEEIQDDEFGDGELDNEEIIEEEESDLQADGFEDDSEEGELDSEGDIEFEIAESAEDDIEPGEADGDIDLDVPNPDGDADDTEIAEAEEVDYSACVDDPYTGNISYNTAYRLPSETQTLDNIVICGTRDDWFVMNLQAGTYFYERTTTQDGSTSSGTFYISDDENILGESLAYAYAVDFTPEGQKTSQLVVEIPETRDYFLAVRRNPVGSSPASLEISLHNEFPVIPGNDCREPFEIDPQAEAPQFYFSSWRYEMLTNNFHGSCMPAITGRDFVIGLDVPEASHVVFDTDSDVDIGIYVRTACDAEASELGCVDADIIREHLELDLVTGRYYIIIDAYEPDGADWFTLSVQMTAP